MTPEEQNLISGLFDRLKKADTAPKDAAAEQLIRQKTAEVPSSPYLLAQSVLVQEHALQNAQARIADLEQQLSAAKEGQKGSHGGFLSGLFGGGHSDKESNAPASPPPVQNVPARQTYAQPAGPVQQPAQYGAPPPLPYPSTTNLQPGSGGTFLKGALATAAGVAGGSLLFQGIENLIGHNSGPFGGLGNLGGSGASFIPEGRGSEVVNNYYVNENQGTQGTDDSGQYVAQNADPTNDPTIGYDPQDSGDLGQQLTDDPGLSDAGFDDGGSFDDGGGNDDTTFA